MIRKKMLCFLFLLPCSLPAQYFFYRVKSETPHNIQVGFGSSVYTAAYMPWTAMADYSVNFNIRNLFTLNFYHSLVQYGTEKFKGTYLPGKSRSAYEYGEIDLGVSLHLVDALSKSPFTVILNLAAGQQFQAMTCLRHILALRGGYNQFKGRTLFDDGNEYPVLLRSGYLGLSWTSIKNFKTWAVQYGTQGAHRWHHAYGDILFMPDDSGITQYGNEANKFGFRLGYQARSTVFSFRIEAGLRPGVKRNAYVSAGIGSRFSLLFKPLGIKVPEPPLFVQYGSTGTPSSGQADNDVNIGPDDSDDEISRERHRDE